MASSRKSWRRGCYTRPVNSKKSESEQKAPPPPGKPFFNGKFSPKKMRKIRILDQWIEIYIDGTGKTITELYPSNEGLIKDGHKMWPPPELVYRRLNFVGSIPPEYDWATDDPERRANGGMAIQRMSVDTWLETIEREKQQGGGHIGPCDKPLPRPPERGGCNCPTCTRLTEQMEAEAQAKS